MGSDGRPDQLLRVHEQIGHALKVLTYVGKESDRMAGRYVPPGMLSLLQARLELAQETAVDALRERDG